MKGSVFVKSLFAVVAASALTASAMASQGGTAGGSGAFVPGPITGQPLGANTLLSGSADGTISGTLDGTLSESARLIMHPDGDGVFTVAGTFQGTLGECGPETVPYHLELQGSLAGYRGVSIGVGQNSAGYTIQITGNASGFTYSGQYHC
jgi:hypothetical protein